MRDKTILVTGSLTVPVVIVAPFANRNFVEVNEFSIVDMLPHLKLSPTHETWEHEPVLRHEFILPKGSYLVHR